MRIFYELGSLVFVLCLGISDQSFAANNPSTFTYQGKLTNTAGTSALLDIVSVKVGIYNPAGTCLLYEETQNVDTTSSGGVFSIEVGQTTTAGGKRTASDPNLSMTTVFANAGTQIRAAGANCAAGYTPAVSDTRSLRFTLTPQSTGVTATLSPDQVLNSVPYALVAQTLQGLAPSSLIQTSTNITQARVEALTDGSDASTLHNHDGRYLSSTSAVALTTNSYANGNFGIGTSIPSGDLGFGGNASRTIIVNRNSTTAGVDLTLQSGGALSGGTNLTGGNLSLSSGISTGTGTSSIDFKTASAGASGTADNSPTTKMTILGNGNVGIGTTAPNQHLDVSGSVRVYDQTAATGSTRMVLRAGAGQSGNVFEVKHNGDFQRFTVDQDGWVWAYSGFIGSNDYLSGFRLYGDIIKHRSAGVVQWTNGSRNDNAVDVGLAREAAGVLRVTDGGSGSATLIASGVGIGTTTPTSPLEIKKNAATLFLNNDGGAANDNPVIKWTTLSALTGLRFVSNSTTVGTIQDNGHFIAGGSISTGGFSVNMNGGYLRFASPSAGVANPDISAPGRALQYRSGVTDGGTAVGHIFDHMQELTTAGAKMASFRNNAVEMAAIDKDGGATFASNVGIGTASPATFLHVAGEDGTQGKIAKFERAGIEKDFYIGSAAVDYVYLASEGALKFRTNVLTSNPYNGAGGVDAMYISSSGNVGIGTTNPSYTLDVAGSARATGDITSWSDVRVKRDIQSLADPLEKILKLEGVSFNWRTDEFPEKKFKNGRDIGVIAQNVETQFPELVETDKDGYKSVVYQKLVAPLIESVKQLYAKLVAHDEVIRTQNKKIEQLSQQTQILQQQLEEIKKQRLTK